MKHKAVLLSLLLLVQASAQTGQLENLEEQLRQARIVREQQLRQLEDLKLGLRSLTLQEQNALNTLQQVNARLNKLDQDRLKVEREIVFKKAQVADLDGQVRVTEARSNRQKVQVQSLMVTLYREKSNLYIQLLAREKNIYDVLIRRHYLDRLSKKDLRVIEELRNTLKQLEGQKAEFSRLTAELRTLQKQLAQKMESVKAEKARQQQAVNALKQTKAGQQALLFETNDAAVQTQQAIANLFTNILAERERIEAERRRREEEERKRREEEQRRLAAERARLEQERKLAQQRAAEAERQRKLAQQQADRAAQERKLAQQKAEQERIGKEQAAIRAREAQLNKQAQESARNNAPLPTNTTVGNLSFPMKGGRVLVPYGRNGQPSTIIAGGQSNAPVSAAAEGRVLSITSNPNLGTVIILAHNDAGTMFTVYSGLQSPTVAVDARVNRGQVIGYTGGSPVSDPNTFDFWVGVRTSSGQTSWIAPGF